MLRGYAKFTLIIASIVSIIGAIYGLLVAEEAESIKIFLYYALSSAFILAVAFGIYMLFNRIEDNHELLQDILASIEEDRRQRRGEKELENAKRIADEVDRQLATSNKNNR